MMIFKNRIDDIDKIKSEIDQYRPLPPVIIPMLKEYFRIGLTYSSNALEGNTLTETETKVILEDGLTIGGKTMREHFEVIGHSQAYDFMWSKASNTQWDEADILELHRLFYHHINEKDAGHYRTAPIFVTGTDFEFPKALEVPGLMKEFIAEIPQLKGQCHPVHYAALVHAKLVTIHPFIDGNGRTARLLMNLALLQSGYVITIIPPLMRQSYISAIRSANKGNMTPFLDFISEMVYESCKEYLRLLRSAL
jgi:Fic family protein